MKFEIKSRYSASILFSLETESLKLCVEAAVKGGADLRGADLRGADLRGADLGWAYLRGADLRGAYLRGADLRGADLRGADLGWADLRGADLRGADLGGTKLQDNTGKELLLVGERPFLQIGPLGSRADYLVAFLTDAGVYVLAGCFFDTLAAFEGAVVEMHGTTVYATEYQMAVALIRHHAEHWTPAETKVAAA